jgi:ribosomal protein S18 acetylase RimI-like enzyme
VVWDGDEVAAVTETFIHADENRALGIEHGWLERISTRRPWRGRGVAKAMIVSAMEALRERGMSQAALGVDADNPSGAFGLYERLGFRVANRMEAVAKPFDPS